MKYLFALLALLISFAASAATANLTFQRPTAYSDGSPLPASAISGYEFVCTTGTTAGVVCPMLTLPGTALGGAMTLTVPVAGGTACINGRTIAGVSIGTVYSNIACKTFPATTPGPPQSVTVAVVIGEDSAPVYTYTSNNVRMGPVAGFVDVGVPCSGGVVFSYRSKQWRRVTQNAVRWWNTAPTSRVAAPCALGG